MTGPKTLVALPGSASVTHDGSVDMAGTSRGLRFAAGVITLSLALSTLTGGISAGESRARADTRARGGDIVFNRSGPCSGQSRARLIVKRRSPRTWGIVYKVRGGPPNLKWSIFMENRGQGFYAGSKISGADGFFRVSTSTRNRANTDKFLVGSNNSVTGEICRSTARV